MDGDECECGTITAEVHAQCISVCPSDAIPDVSPCEVAYEEVKTVCTDGTPDRVTSGVINGKARDVSVAIASRLLSELHEDNCKWTPRLNFQAELLAIRGIHYDPESLPSESSIRWRGGGEGGVRQILLRRFGTVLASSRSHRWTTWTLQTYL